MITVLGLRRPLGPHDAVARARDLWVRLHGLDRHRLPRSGGLRRPAATGHPSRDKRACSARNARWDSPGI